MTSLFRLYGNTDVNKTYTIQKFNPYVVTGRNIQFVGLCKTELQPFKVERSSIKNTIGSCKTLIENEFIDQVTSAYITLIG